MGGNDPTLRAASQTHHMIVKFKLQFNVFRVTKDSMLWRKCWRHGSMFFPRKPWSPPPKKPTPQSRNSMRKALAVFHFASISSVLSKAWQKHSNKRWTDRFEIYSFWWGDVSRSCFARLLTRMEPSIRAYQLATNDSPTFLMQRWSKTSWTTELKHVETRWEQHEHPHLV